MRREIVFILGISLPLLMFSSCASMVVPESKK